MGYDAGLETIDLFVSLTGIPVELIFTYAVVELVRKEFCCSALVVSEILPRDGGMDESRRGLSYRPNAIPSIASCRSGAVYKLYMHGN